MFLCRFHLPNLGLIFLIFTQIASRFGPKHFKKPVIPDFLLYNFWVKISRIFGENFDMFYGTAAWDPWHIVAQIVCLQCLYYLSLGVFLSILVGTRVSKMSLVYFFDYATVTASTVIGWGVMASIFISSIAGASALVYLVERSKKCLDFCATLYIIHLLICIVYGGWPLSITWWVVNITSLAVMALLGEYLCMRRELQEIPISRYRSSA